MLIDLLLYSPFTSLGRPFRNLLPDAHQHSIASPMHALPTFFFFIGAARTRRIPLGGAEPQATNGLAQKRCVRPVHLRDRGLCLSLGLCNKKKKKKTLACRAASDTKETWEEVGSSMGAVERLASLGFIALWFFSLARHRGLYFFSCFSLGSSGTATDVFITIVSFSSLSSCIGAERREVHIRRDGTTDYFPSSLLLARAQGVALPSITFFFLIFSYVWTSMRNRRCGIFFSLASIVIPPGPTMPVLL